MSKTFTKANLIDAASSSLDRIDANEISDGDRAYVVTDSSNFYVFFYDADNGGAEDSPNIIAPNKLNGAPYTGDGRWIKAFSTYDVTFDYAIISTEVVTNYLDGARGPLLVLADPSSNLGGQVAGLQVWINADTTATPAVGDHVAGQFYISNLNSRQHIWGLDIAALQDPTGTDGWARGIEVEIADCSNSSTDPFGSDGFVQLGIDITGHSGSTNRPTTALRVWANDDTGDKWWYEGISLSRCYQYGIHFYADPGPNTDDIDAFGATGGAAIFDDSNSEAVIKTDTTHPNSVIDLGNISAGDGTSYNLIRTPMSADTDLVIKNYADFGIGLALDSGTSATKDASIRFKDQGTSKWAVGKDLDNNFLVYDHASTRPAFSITPAGRYVFHQSDTPASQGAAGTAGTFAWDADYVYICISTDTWKRVAIATWP